MMLSLIALAISILLVFNVLVLIRMLKEHHELKVRLTRLEWTVQDLILRRNRNASRT